MVRFYLLDLKQMRNRQSFYTKPVDIKTSLAKNFATSQLRNFAITPFLREITAYTTHGKYFRAFFYLT